MDTHGRIDNLDRQSLPEEVLFIYELGSIQTVYDPRFPLTSRQLICYIWNHRMGNSFAHLKSESANNVKEDYYEKAKILFGFPFRNLFAKWGPFHFVCLNVQLIHDRRRQCS
jgi:hypothetical protein